MRQVNCRALHVGISVVMMVCFVLAGCTSARKHQPARDRSAKPYKLESEGTIPPLPESQVRKEVDRVDTFEEMPVGEEAISVENVEPVAEPATEAAPEQTAPKTMNGYRVQVLASGNEVSARMVKETVEATLGVPAYIDLIDGVYKVRTGNCPTREEAEALLKRCRDAGYGDAWIVGCPIVLQKKTQTQ
ncbi:MAG: SPOR domain-containing protein [Candidatus Latescibacterota bacterium]|nr:MAG: SPOR domain-containing protein [Candidatus Latescibacterota bacterium]